MRLTEETRSLTFLLRHLAAPASSSIHCRKKREGSLNPPGRAHTTPMHLHQRRSCTAVRVCDAETFNMYSGDFLQARGRGERYAQKPGHAPSVSACFAPFVYRVCCFLLRRAGCMLLLPGGIIIPDPFYLDVAMVRMVSRPPSKAGAPFPRAAARGPPPPVSPGEGGGPREREEGASC